MASEDVGALVARVIADTEQFKSEMQKMGARIDSSTAKMNRSLATVDKNLAAMRSGFGLATKAAGAFGVALSVTALINFGRQTIKATAELGSLSERLGASTEALSELSYVAQQSDVQVNTLTLGLQRMTRRVAEAAQGTGEARGALRELGLDARLLSGLPLDQQFERIADAMSGVTQESDRVRLAMKLFDSEGVALIQTMNDGARGIQRMRQEARDLGQSISQDMVDKAEKADEAMQRMKASVSALGRELTLSLVPAITAVATGWNRILFGADPNPFEAEINATQRRLEFQKANMAVLERGGDVHSRVYKEMASEVEELTKRLDELLAKQRQAMGLGVEGATPGKAKSTPIQGLDELPTRLDAIPLGKRRDPLGDLERSQALAPLEAPETPIAALLEEIDQRKLAEQDYTSFLEAQYRQRVTAAASAAAEEAETAISAQQQQLDFRAGVAAASANLLIAVFGQSKAVQLAAIAFEKLIAVRRIKIATDLAAWQAFQSQLIPGDPTSLARATAAYAAVKARGAVTVAQTVALSVISGLAEAAQVVGSNGSPGSFTNPIAVTSGSRAAQASTGAQRANRERDVVELHFHGDVYGWDDYVEHRIIDGIQRAVNGRDVILFRGDSAQGALLGAPG